MGSAEIVVPEPVPFHASGTNPLLREQESIIGTPYFTEGFIANGSKTGKLYRVTAGEEQLALKIFTEVDVPEQISTSAEIEIQAKLKGNPGIAPVTDAGTLVLSGVKHRYMALPYRPEGSLFRRIKDRPLTTDEAAQMGQEITIAADAIHRLNVVHGDIKPDNILVVGAEANAYELIDFGIVARVTSTGIEKEDDGVATLAYEPEDIQIRQLVGQILGTKGFIPPEVLEADAEATEKVDVFGIGATMYRATTGETPYLGKSTGNALPIEEYKEIVKSGPPIEPVVAGAHISSSLNELIVACMDPNPINRPDTSHLRDLLAAA